MANNNDFSDLADDINSNNSHDFSDLASDIQYQEPQMKNPPTVGQSALTGFTSGLQTFANTPLQFNRFLLSKMGITPTSSGLGGLASQSTLPVSNSDIKSSQLENPFTYGLSNAAGTITSAIPLARLNLLSGIPTATGRFLGPISSAGKYLGNLGLQGAAGQLLNNSSSSPIQVGESAGLNMALGPVWDAASSLLTGAAPRAIQSLFGSAKATKEATDTAYKNVFKAANDAGVSVNPSQSFNEAQNQLDLINNNYLPTDQEKLKPATDAINDFMSDVTDPRYKNGISLQIMKNKSKTLGDLAYDLSKGDSFQRASSGHIMQLKDALDQDALNSTAQSGNPNLYGMLKNADSMYSTKYIPLKQNPLFPTWQKIGEHPLQALWQIPAALLARNFSKLNGGPLSVLKYTNNPTTRAISLQQSNNLLNQ